MDNICNGYSRPNDFSAHGLGNLVEKRQGNLRTMKRKRWFCFGIDGKSRTKDVTEGWRRKVPVRQRRSYLPSHSRDRRPDVASSCPSSLLNTFSSARLDLSRVFPFLSHENYGEETWQWPRERNIISVFAFLGIIEIEIEYIQCLQSTCTLHILCIII